MKKSREITFERLYAASNKKPDFPPSERALAIIKRIKKLNAEAGEKAMNEHWKVASMGCIVGDTRSLDDIAKEYVNRFEYDKLEIL